MTELNMGSNQHIKKLLQKFIDNTISKSEFEELFRYIDKLDIEDDVKIFMIKHWEEINSKAFHNPLNLSKNDELLNTILEKISNQNQRSKPTIIHLISRWYSVAAIFAIMFSVGYFYYTGLPSSNEESVLPLSEEVITLKLDNGEVKVISEKNNEQIVNASGLVVGTQNGNVIAYENNISEDKLTYNTLTVPYGKRFQIVLSDGTKVHLNAGTSLKYPVKFITGLNREVFLDGEAYFDVVKDAEHPFLVNADDLNISVLGTKFNVTSYPENELINTVLVEGSVEVFKKDAELNSKERSILQPGYKAAWHKQNKNIRVDKVNIEQFTAWMDGRLILNEVAFENIQKKLERQYNVTFINNDEILKQRKFTARFDIENIDQVMKSLSASATFTYKINNNQIIINP